MTTSINIRRGTPHATANPHRAGVLVTPSRKRFFIMVLLFITVVINYLDRSNLSIAAPAMTSELGIDPIARRADLLRVRLDVRRHADPRRLAGRSRAAAHSVQRRIAAVVDRHGDARLRCQFHRVVRIAHGGRCAGSAGVSDQQPRGDDVVSRARTCHGDRFLHVGAVRRPGIPDAGTGLAAASNLAGTWCSSPPARWASSGR